MRMTSSRLRLLLLPAVVALAACGRTVAPPHAERVAVQGGERYSLYELGSTWRDERGEQRALAALGGRPRVIAMVYTHCGASCPITVAEMKRIAASTPAGVGFVLVSLDPERDTPGRLASYAADLALDPARWTLLNGPDDQVRELAALLGVRYRRTSAAELAHSNVLTLVDAAGVVVRQQQGLDGTAGTIDAARALLR